MIDMMYIDISTCINEDFSYFYIAFFKCNIKCAHISIKCARIIIFQINISSGIKKHLNHICMTHPGCLVQWGVAIKRVSYVDTLLLINQLLHCPHITSRNRLKQLRGSLKHLRQVHMSLLIGKVNGSFFMIKIFSHDIGSCLH